MEQQVNAGQLVARFVQDARTLSIFGAIVVDVVSGIMVAVKLKIFDLRKLATFYRSNVVPYIIGYFAYWLVVAIGLDMYLPSELTTLLNTSGASVVVLALYGSIRENFNRLRAPVVAPELADMRDTVPSDLHG